MVILSSTSSSISSTTKGPGSGAKSHHTLSSIGKVRVVVLPTATVGRAMNAIVDWCRSVAATAWRALLIADWSWAIMVVCAASGTSSAAAANVGLLVPSTVPSDQSTVVGTPTAAEATPAPSVGTPTAAETTPTRAVGTSTAAEATPGPSVGTPTAAVTVAT
jgi:hypothetical protein